MSTSDRRNYPHARNRAFAAAAVVMGLSMTAMGAASAAPAPTSPSPTTVDVPVTSGPVSNLLPGLGSASPTNSASQDLFSGFLTKAVPSVAFDTTVARAAAIPKHHEDSKHVKKTKKTKKKAKHHKPEHHKPKHNKGKHHPKKHTKKHTKKHAATTGHAHGSHSTHHEGSKATSFDSTVLRIAASKAGTPYVYGATGPNAFDCSGYTRWVYEHAGKDLPRTSSEQAGYAHRVSSGDARPGDLVFFHDGGGVYHVAIYAGDDSVWHAPHTGAVVRKEHIWTSAVTYGRI